MGDGSASVGREALPSFQAPLDLYTSDDYCGLVTTRFAFYFGYEATLCPHHGKDARCHCDEEEWCFTASHKGDEYARFTRSELDQSVKRSRLDEPYSYLLAGIGRVL